MRYTGKLNIYFPCEVRTSDVNSYRKKWEKIRRIQKRVIQREGMPTTELYDSEQFRNQTESMLELFCMKHFIPFNNEYSPFASSGIMKSYHGLREDSLFSKNLSAKISDFIFSLSQDGNSKKKKVNGKLILNINLENGIGVFVCCFPLNNLSSNDIVLLKHIHYKRLGITIDDDRIQKPTTIQRYVSYLINTDLKRLKIRNVDYRARYSMMELDNNNDLTANILDYYAMLKADESGESAKEDNLTGVFGKNLFNHNTRGYYVHGTDSIILHNLKDNKDKYTLEEKTQEFCIRSKCMLEQKSDSSRNSFREHCNATNYPGNISIMDERYYCPDDAYIAGIKNNLFPEFLRAVELHYMLDKVLSSEIVAQKRSAVKFWIFIYRAYLLWCVIYDKAVNKYHINEDLMISFGINQSLDQIKSEYNSTQTQIFNFTAILLSIFSLTTAIFTLIITIKTLA